MSVVGEQDVGGKGGKGVEPNGKTVAPNLTKFSNMGSHMSSVYIYIYVCTYIVFPKAFVHEYFTLLQNQQIFSS